MKNLLTTLIAALIFFNAQSQNRVGIGTATPQSKLDVVGKIRGTELQVTTNPQTGYVLTSDAVGNATWDKPGILDSLVLRDSTGDIRMIMNPNTGTFKMLDNDTVWYSIQVNSPSYEFHDNGFGKTQEVYTAANGDRIYREAFNGTPTYTRTTSKDAFGNTIDNTTKYDINGDVLNVTETNSGLLYRTETTYYENGQIVKKTVFDNGIITDYYYENGVVRKKVETGTGIDRTTEYRADGTTSTIQDKSTDPNQVHVEITTYHDASGQATGTWTRTGQYFPEEVWAPAGGDSTIVTGGYMETNGAGGYSAVVQPEKITCESPTGGTNETSPSGSEQKNGTITITNGIDLSDASGLTGGFSCTEDATGNGIGLAAHPGGQSIDVFNEPGGTTSGSLFRFKFDSPDSAPKLELFWYDPTIGDIVPASMFFNPNKHFQIQVTDPVSNNAIDLGFDPIGDVLYGSAEQILWAGMYDVLLGSKIKFDFTNDEPELSLEYFDPDISDFRVTTLLWDPTDDLFKLGVTDPITTNSVGIHFDPANEEVIIRGSNIGADAKLVVTGDIQADNNVNVNGATVTADAVVNNVLAANNINPIAPSNTVTFNGNVQVNGTLNAFVKLFTIDHPLDPENQKLNHACIESDEMVNIYSGKISTDENGNATVQLEEWMTALNTDFRYQLTVIGGFSQAIIAEEISNDNSFVIRTDKPNVKVSWEITGVRQDKWALENPLEVEVAK